jgi:hypothetical protein
VNDWNDGPLLKPVSVDGVVKWLGPLAAWAEEVPFPAFPIPSGRVKPDLLYLPGSRNSHPASRKPRRQGDSSHLLHFGRPHSSFSREHANDTVFVTKATR